MKQDELKALHRAMLERDAWPNSPHMVDYCLSEAAYYVELEDGDVLPIDKPRIETSFCFGYDCSSYDNTSFDNANAAVRNANTNPDYFLKENIKQLNGFIDALEGRAISRRVPCIRRRYDAQSDGPRIVDIAWINPYRDDVSAYKELSAADRSAVVEGYRLVKASFEKRLRRYLKRYGLSKLHTWSYWRD